MKKFFHNILKRPAKRLLLRSLMVASLLALFGAVNTLRTQQLNHQRDPATTPQTLGYSSTPQANHRQVRTTVFWVGEEGHRDNRFITNRTSAWVSDWVKAFGGIDDPKKRCGLNPCGFTPRENPFYFALPFNDYGADGKAKPDAVLRRIPWYTNPPLPKESVVKNQWIAATHQDKTVYAQWEDVGPFGEDDTDYVFGDKPPQAGVGLDLSPAAAAYLGINGEAKVSWHFVEPSSVPDGPWKTTVTVSGLNFSN